MKTPALLALLCLAAVPARSAGPETVISKHAATLTALGKKDDKGGWVVSEGALAEVKKDIGRVLKQDPAGIAIHTDQATGSALIGGCVSGVLKDDRTYYVLDSRDEKLVAQMSVLAGMFKDEAGREKFLSAVYTKDGYKVAVGVKLCTGSFELMRDGGSIRSSVTCPDGEKLVIRRIQNDPATLTVNLLPFKNIL